MPIASPSPAGRPPAPRLAEISPAPVSSRYRRRFGLNPRQAGAIHTYSRRELEMLGLLVPMPTLWPPPP